MQSVIALAIVPKTRPRNTYILKKPVEAVLFLIAAFDNPKERMFADIYRTGLTKLARSLFGKSLQNRERIKSQHQITPFLG